MESKFYTVNQIAKMFNMHPKTIRRYIQKGSLTARKIGKEWRVLESDLKSFLDSSVEFQENHLENALEDVNDFIHGEGVEQAGTINVLTIADVFVETSEEAKEYCSNLVEVIKATGESKAQFKFFFTEESKRARFILSGSPKYIDDMLKVLQKEN